MPARIHAIVEDADDLNDAFLRHAIENHMGRVCDRHVPTFRPAVANMKTANAWDQVGAIYGRTPFGIGRDAPYCGGKACSVAKARLFAMDFFASSQNDADVGFRELRKPIARHARLTEGRRGKIVEIAVQFRVIDVRIVAAIERGYALLD
jgi:hypothetical protein